MLNTKRRSHHAHYSQGGMSIVELMVGVAIGLIIVAAASLLMAGQLVENRRLITEAQVQQDLRATADLISRDIRRAGRTGEVNALGTIWYPDSPSALPNAVGNSLSTPPSNTINFAYVPGPFFSVPFGFKLQSEVVKRMASNSPQDLTDGNVMKTTSLNPSVLGDSSATLVLPCPRTCSDGSSDCWPKYHVRRVRIEMLAEAKADTSIKRAARSTVRVRNDRVEFAGTEICPA